MTESNESICSHLFPSAWKSRHQGRPLTWAENIIKECHLPCHGFRSMRYNLQRAVIDRNMYFFYSKMTSPSLSGTTACAGLAPTGLHGLQQPFWYRACRPPCHIPSGGALDSSFSTDRAILTVARKLPESASAAMDQHLSVH